MRPLITSGIALFNPQGFIDGNNAPNIIPMQDLQHTLSLDVEAVLISLEKVVFFNKNGISMLVEVMDNIRQKKGCLVGFVDYNEKTFKTMMSIYPEGISFCLFESFEVATLFAGSSKTKRGSKILIWHKDKGQRNNLVFSLYGRGFEAHAVDNLEEFYELQDNTEKLRSLRSQGFKKAVDPQKQEEEAEQKAQAEKEAQEESSSRHKIQGPFDHAISMTHIGHSNEKIASHIQGNLVIYSMDDYIDADINDKFDLIYHQKSLTVGFKLFVFECESVLSMNIHGVHFFAKISVAAAEYGATISIAGLRKDALQEAFRNELEDSGILFFENLRKLLDDKKTLQEYGGGAIANKKSKIQINKKLIGMLPVFIDSAIHTMDTLTNTKPTKKSAEITKIKINDDPKNLIASTIGFFGDVDGLLVLIFSKNIAQKACMILLGEEEHEMETLQDAISELVNIMGGRSKTALSWQNTNIKITLPRTFDSIDALLENFNDKKGCQVILSFGDEPFYLFLTR